MAVLTDTARIDWLASKGCVEIEAEYLGPIRIMSNFRRIGSGPDLRTAIDAAMRREKLKAKSAAPATEGDAT